MPTYEYRCTACAHIFEEFQAITAEPFQNCPQCGKPTLRRGLGGGSGMIFKGSGFYLTDYKKGSPPAPKDSPKGGGAGKHPAPKDPSSSEKKAAKPDDKS